MGIKSELHEAILKRGGKVPPYGGIAAAMDELNKLPGGGGDCDWNIMKNKPFYKETTVGELFPKTTLTVDSEIGAALLDGVWLVDGKTYTISYNGVSYECIAHDVGESIAVGNIGAFIEGTDTGEPFVAINDMGSGSVGLMPLDGSTTVEVSIRGIVTTVKPIDPECLPCLFVDFQESGHGSPYVMLSDIAFDTVISALESGQKVVFRDRSSSTSVTVYYAAVYSSVQIVCRAFYTDGYNGNDGAISAKYVNIVFEKGDNGNVVIGSYESRSCSLKVYV